jgi:hypothetical protein
MSIHFFVNQEKISKIYLPPVRLCHNGRKRRTEKTNGVQSYRTRGVLEEDGQVSRCLKSSVFIPLGLSRHYIMWSIFLDILGSFYLYLTHPDASFYPYPYHLSLPDYHYQSILETLGAF